MSPQNTTITFFAVPLFDALDVFLAAVAFELAFPAMTFFAGAAFLAVVVALEVATFVAGFATGFLVASAAVFFAGVLAVVVLAAEAGLEFYQRTLVCNICAKKNTDGTNLLCGIWLGLGR